MSNCSGTELEWLQTRRLRKNRRIVLPTVCCVRRSRTRSAMSHLPVNPHTEMPDSRQLMSVQRTATLMVHGRQATFYRCRLTHQGNEALRELWRFPLHMSFGNSRSLAKYQAVPWPNPAGDFAPW
ncbi:hypothetical protein N7528_004225 [Penicillium herquei]|nr:hypothetical protein N7528_004225 [Penicillium herquei]